MTPLTVSGLRALLEADYRRNERITLQDIRFRWKHLDQHLGSLDASLVGGRDIERYKDVRLAEGASRGTINHELSGLRTAFRIAVEQELIPKAPRIRDFRLSNARQGFIRPEALHALLRTLEALDPPIADLVEALYLLGWRSGELKRLTWADVEIDGMSVTLTLPAKRHKNRQPKRVRLGRELAALFFRRWEKRDGPYVFHRSMARPIRSFRAIWLRAVRARGLEWLRPHDLRRSFAREGILAGVPAKVLMEIAGWRSRSIFDRYAVIDEEDMARGLDLLAAATARMSRENGREAPEPPSEGNGDQP
jgi:integrase